MFLFDLHNRFSVPVEKNTCVNDIIRKISHHKNQTGLDTTVSGKKITFKNKRIFRISTDRFSLIESGQVDLKLNGEFLEIYFFLKMSAFFKFYCAALFVLFIFMSFHFYDIYLTCFLLFIWIYIFIGSAIIAKIRYRNFIIKTIKEEIKSRIKIGT